MYGFRIFSLPFLGFFSPFLHSTGSLSVSQKYLALPDGAGRFTQNFTGSVLLRILTGWFLYVYGTFTLYGQVFQACSTSYTSPYVSPTTPCNTNTTGFGLIRVRSPLLAESLLFSIPPGTEMFQFPGFSTRLGRVDYSSSSQVSPFGHPRIKACLQLPAAYRSLPRPSSSLRA